jgi:hypothetical protein
MMHRVIEFCHSSRQSKMLQGNTEARGTFMGPRADGTVVFRYQYYGVHGQSVRVRLPSEAVDVKEGLEVTLIT